MLPDAWKEHLSNPRTQDICLFEILLFRLQKLLEEQGIKLFPGDDRQLLMVLRAANSDPELAVEVAKKYISFSRYVLDSKE